MKRPVRCIVLSLLGMLLCAPTMSYAQFRATPSVPLQPIVSPGSAATTPSADPIILRNADSLVVNTIDSQMIRELVGHVHLDHGNVSVFCDHAVQNLATNVIVLSGSVKIVQGTVTMLMPRGEYQGNSGEAFGSGGVTILDRRTTLKAPNGVYNTRNNQADFHGGVDIEDDTVRIKAQDLRYLKSSQESWLWGHVRLFSKVSSSAIVGDSAHNIPATSYSVIRGNPLLVHVDTVSNPAADSIFLLFKKQQRDISLAQKKLKVMKKGNAKSPLYSAAPKSKKTKTPEVADSSSTRPSAIQEEETLSQKLERLFHFDTLTIRSHVMESFRGGGADRYVASGAAEVVRKNMRAKAGRCVYDKTAESIELRQDPELWADSLHLAADSLWVSLPNRRLRMIQAWHSAFLLMIDSSRSERAHQIAGDHIEISIDQDTVRSIRSLKDAKSLYFMSTEDGPDGASRTLCDSLFLVFNKGELQNIIWRSGVNSEYYPENLVGGGARSYYLSGYKEPGQRPAKPNVAKRFSESSQNDEEKRSTRENDRDSTPSEPNTTPEK